MTKSLAKKAKDLSLPQKLGLAAVIVTILTGMASFANQAEIAEPHWPATRDFVRTSVSQATSKVESRQITTQIYLAKSERSRIENELANKQVLISQNPTMPQPIRSAIDEQIRALNRDLEATKQAIENLGRERDRVVR